MFKTKLSLFLAISMAFSSFSQIGSSIASSRRVNWNNFGYGVIPTTYAVTVNVKNFGALGNGATDDTQAIQNAINSASGTSLTMIYFPPGEYRINGNLLITKNKTVLKGAGPSYTRLKFYNTTGQCISILGTPPASTDPGVGITAGNQKGSTSLTLASTSSIAADDYVELRRDMDPVAVCNLPEAAVNCAATVTLANHTYGQVVKVTAKSGNIITLEDGLAMDYYLPTFRVHKFTAIKDVGIEDIALEKKAGSGYNIYISNAAGAWISGIESDYTLLHHIGVESSTKVEVRGSYIHNADINMVNAGNGGYGVFIGARSSNCLVEDNVFEKLRHSVVLSGSPTRNIIGYNYADITLGNSGNNSQYILHGFYPHSNLLEGNIANYMEVDENWGWNGTYNTLFRNKCSIWKLSGSDYLNVVGNIPYTNSATSIVLPNLLTLKNSMSAGHLSDISYYRTSKPSFVSDNYTWPLMGCPTASSGALSNTNPAETRFKAGGQYTINKRNPLVGYSISNTGLITGLNASDNSVYNRNKGELSIGTVEYYTNPNGSWDVGPVTTVVLPGGQEEIISSYNSTGSATVYISTNKNAGGQTLIFNQPNAVVTALTSGDFNGDGINEIVIGYLQNGRPYLYKSTNPANLLQTLIYTNVSVYWRIDALTAGDFNGDGKDELIIGLNANGPDTQIYKSMDALSLGTAIYTNNNGYWDIIALAAGDFNGDGKDELIEAFQSVNGSSIYKSVNADVNLIPIYTGTNYWKVGAMAAGDFDNDGDDELITGFNSASQGPSIYKSEHADNTNEVLIFSKANTYWTLKSLAIEKIHITATGGKPSGSESLASIEEETNEMGLNIYPNPSKGIFNIMIDEGNQETYTVEIFDAYGRKVHGKISETHSTEIDMSMEPSGIYHVRVTTGNNVLQNKIIIE